jgi:hypothetical protein
MPDQRSSKPRQPAAVPAKAVPSAASRSASLEETTLLPPQPSPGGAKQSSPQEATLTEPAKEAIPFRGRHSLLLGSTIFAIVLLVLLIVGFVVRPSWRTENGEPPPHDASREVKPSSSAANKESGGKVAGSGKPIGTRPRLASDAPIVRSPSEEFTPPDVLPIQWHDLLPLLDVNQDKLQGDWQLLNGELVGHPVAASDKPAAPPAARLSLPAIPQGEYHLRLQLQLNATRPSAVIVLPVADRQVVFAINALVGGKLRSGFEKIGAQRLDQNPAWTSAVRPDSGQPYQLDLIVLPKDDRAELFALWDGQPACRWAGLIADLSVPDEFRPPGESTICVAGLACSIQIHALQLGLISGALRTSRELPNLMLASSRPEQANSGTPATLEAKPNEAPIVTEGLPAEGIDLLKTVDAAKDSIRGDWTLTGGVLQSSQRADGALIQFPVHPPDHYRIELVVERLAGNDFLALVLTTPAGTQVIAYLDEYAGTKSVLAYVDGHGPFPDNPTMIDQPLFSPGRITRLRFEVDRDRVRVFQDDKPLLAWQGDFKRTAIDGGYFTLRDGKALALATHNSAFRIYEARLLPLAAPPRSNQREGQLVAAALTRVQNQFSAEYAAAKKTEQKLALAKSLLDTADRSFADLPQQIALWDEARRFATEGNDYRLAMQALERRHARFPLELLSMVATICENVQLPAAKRADNLALAELAMKWMERAVEDDQLDPAVRLGLAAQTAIKKLSDRDRTKVIGDRLTEVRTIQAEAVKIGSSGLQSGPSQGDAEANLALGRYRCFFKNDWSKGLPNLAAGSDPRLQLAAKKETENPAAAAAQLAVAEQWWDSATKLSREAKRNVLRHAAEWYVTALPSLTGAPRTTALNRIQEAVQTRPQSLPTLMPQGIVAYWGFDDASGRLAQDAAGKHHALLTKARWTQGIRGGAVEFTAGDQFVQFPAIGSAPIWTLALWTRIDRLRDYGNLFSTLGRKRGNFQLTLRSDGVVDATIQESASGSSQGPLSTGNWHHIAFRYDDGSCSLYVDGHVQQKYGANKEIPPLLGPGRIGGWYEDGTPRLIVGAVDDVRLYGRVLADEEVALLAELPR